MSEFEYIPRDPAALRKRLDDYASAPRPDLTDLNRAAQLLDRLGYAGVARWVAAIEIQERRKRDVGNPNFGAVDYRSDDARARGDLAWRVVAYVIGRQDEYMTNNKERNVPDSETQGYIDAALAGDPNEPVRKTVDNILRRGRPAARRGCQKRGLSLGVLPILVSSPPPITSE